MAIKILDEGPSLESNGRGDALLEGARRAMGLDHPNIVRVRDCGRDDEGFYYIVSDYVLGETFRERISVRGRMGQVDALGAAKAILSALVHLHGKGLVHGNLKLENILLSGRGTPVVTDAALSLFRGLDSVMTPSDSDRVAPELLSGGLGLTPQSDLFMVGAILFELLTGRPVFGDPGSGDRSNASLRPLAPAPSLFAEGITGEVDDIVCKALRTGPSRRYASAVEMLAAVEAALLHVRQPPALPGGKWNYLLAFAPIALGAHALHANPLFIFVASCLAILPLAAILSESTEHLAEQVGPSLGGFLNATFGNATEILIAIFGIWRGGSLVDTVKASLTGSILGNLLFVLGLAMLLGGWHRERQTFNRTAAGVGNTLMIVAVVGLLVPSIMHAIYQADPKLADLDASTAQRLSLIVAVVLLFSYGLNLLFSLKTHHHLTSTIPEVNAEPGEEDRLMSKGRATTLMVLATLGVSLLSEALVGSVEAAGHILHINPLFMGLVVIAMVGNAAEHATAVTVAMKNKMDLALAIAVGSSVQVALFLAPFLVLVSWLIGRPMDLVFTPMEVVAVTVGVGITMSVSIDGESTWIEGALLLAVYVILAAAFWYVPTH